MMTLLQTLMFLCKNTKPTQNSAKNFFFGQFSYCACLKKMEKGTSAPFLSLFFCNIPKPTEFSLRKGNIYFYFPWELRNEEDS